MAAGELACTYAAVILHDDGIPVTAEKISTLVKAANLSIESYWPNLFAKLVKKKNIDDLVMNVGTMGGATTLVSAAAPAADCGVAAAAPITEEEKEQKEESDDDMGFSLFD